MNLIQGLSDFWLRFFADYPLLQQFYQGSMDLLEAAYLRMLESTLTLSLRDTPVFRKEFFKLIVIRETDVMPADTQYAVDLTASKIKNFPFLYNKILEPTVILEKLRDFEIVCNGETATLLFKKNPFNWNGSGETIPGVAVTIIDGVRYISFWAPNIEFDAADLYIHYGYLITKYAPSSEAYKAFLEGLLFYFAIAGPTRPYIESMLNIIVGLAVARDDEILKEVVTTTTETAVITDKHTYTYHPLVPIREDILNPSNWGSLTLHRFEPITTVFKVTDYVIDPTWYYGEVISPRLLVGEGVDRRTAWTTLYENRINNPAGNIKIGDLGFYIGADDDGYVPSGRIVTYRHGYGFCVFNILKHNVLSAQAQENVLLEGVVSFVEFAENILANIVPGKPVYVFFDVVVPIKIEDSLLLNEAQFVIEIDSTLPEELYSPTPAFLRIADFSIGDYYEYDVDGELDVRTYDDDPPTEYPNTAGKMPVCVGMNALTSTTIPCMRDMPLEIKRS